MRSALTRYPLPRILLRPHASSYALRPHPVNSISLRSIMSAAPPSEELLAEIASLGDTIRQLKLSKQPFTEEVAKLKELKAKLPPAPEKPKVEGEGGKSGKGKNKKGSEAHGGKLQLKVPKGTKDFLPHETTVRKKIFSILESTFVAHGASTIDTPVFELKDILSGKYGEDSKLIYDLQDQGGELCSLRYDLTVPFARFLAMNQIQSMKRYHIAKVYRRDQPVMSKGRLREFYQCDIDIAGTYDPMVPDAEVLVILCEVLTKLEIGEFTVKINHRKILDGIFAISGVPEASTRAISSAVDKLDKSPWSEVRREMIEDKNLDPVVADKIGEYVKLKGRGPDLLAKLEADATMTGNKIAAEGLKDMKILFEYLEVFGVLEKMSFDLSLARGLDYYTGIIYEAITEASAPPSFAASNTSALPSLDSTTPPSTSEPKKDSEGVAEVDESSVGVGSIAAGGRYDNLVGMFSSAAAGPASGGKKEKVNVVPCVGVSVGVERVYAILMAKEAEKRRLGEKSARGKETEVYVMSVGDGLVKERMQICKELWDVGIKAEFMYKVKPKLQPQFETVDRDAIPFAVIIGSNEIKDRVVRVKDQTRTKEELEKEEGGAANGTVIKREEMIEWLKARIAKL